MGRVAAMLVALLCYAAFFATFLYLVGFVAGFETLPTHVDKGMEAPPATAALVDIALIALFGVQHSVMARQGFKRGWTRVVPAPIERSIYVLAASAVLVVLFAFWHPIEGSVWSIQSETGRIAMWTLFAIGWAILFVSTWLLNHFELFGLAQTWRHFRGLQDPPMNMRTPLFYKAVRHPLYTGFFIGFWATPEMTYGHLLLAVGFTIYIVIGIVYEERDLVGWFGDEYLDYRRRVGAFIPGIGKRA